VEWAVWGAFQECEGDGMKLCEVVWPGFARGRVEELGGEVWRLQALMLRLLLQDGAEKQRNVLGTVAKGWEHDPQRGEGIRELGREAAHADERADAVFSKCDYTGSGGAALPK
jgi:hypothetical protein